MSTGIPAPSPIPGRPPTWTQVSPRTCVRLYMPALSAIRCNPPLPPGAWPLTPVQPGAVLVLRPRLAGQAFRIIATIALIIVSIAVPHLAPATVTALGIALGASGAASAFALGAAIVSATISIVGGLLLNALLPVRPPDLPAIEGAQPGPIYQIAGIGNTARPNRPLRLVLGRHRVYPDVAAPTYHLPVDGQQQQGLRLDLLVGVGDLEISDVAIDGVDPATLTDESVRTVITRGTRHDNLLSVVTREGLGDLEAEFLGIYTSPPKTKRAELDFGSTVVRFGVNNERTVEQREVRLEVRALGATQWHPLTSMLPNLDRIPSRDAVRPEAVYGPWIDIPLTSKPVFYREFAASGREDRPVESNGRTWTRPRWIADTDGPGGSDEDLVDRWRKQWNPSTEEIDYYLDLRRDFRETIAGEIINTVPVWFARPDTWQVRVRRTDPASTANLVQDRISWLRTRAVVEDPEADYTGQVRLSMRVRPEAGLQGRLGRVSCLAGLRVSIRDADGAMLRREVSSNPAWIFAEYATGLQPGPNFPADQISLPGSGVGGAGLPSERIDWAGIAEWAAWCEEEGLTCDTVIESPRTHRDVLGMIARCGLAAPTFATGRLGVVIDRPEPVSSLITPGSIVAGSLSVAWASGADLADAIDVRWIDPDQGWQVATERVPVPGSTGPAARPATVTAEGVTSRANARREGHRQAARQVYHRRRIRWEMAAEGLDVSLGDVVRLTHGLLDGGTAGRLAGGSPAQPILGPNFPADQISLPGAGDRLLLRLNDGALHEAGIEEVVDAATGEVRVDPPVPASAWPAAGTAADVLWRLYAAGDPPAAVRIVSIEPQGDGTVRVEAIDEVAEYYAGDA